MIRGPALGEPPKSRDPITNHTSQRQLDVAPQHSCTPSIRGTTEEALSLGWCAREDLNLHSFRNQILSLARLPFRHARNR